VYIDIDTHCIFNAINQNKHVLLIALFNGKCFNESITDANTTMMSPETDFKCHIYLCLQNIKGSNFAIDSDFYIHCQNNAQLGFFDPCKYCSAERLLGRSNRYTKISNISVFTA